MNIEHIITESLINYDTAQPVIRYLMKNAKFEGEKFAGGNKRTIFRFYDKKTNELLLETETEILGVFYDKLDVWSWAWSHTGLGNAENYLAKEILIYALKLGSDLTYLKSILTTSRGVVKDITQIDINIALGAGIIKQPYIYPYIYRIDDYNLYYYLILLNKEQLDKLAERIRNQIEENDDFDIDEN